jgi:vesicle-fusing ATPase
MKNSCRFFYVVVVLLNHARWCWTLLFVPSITTTPPYTTSSSRSLSALSDSGGISSTLPTHQQTNDVARKSNDLTEYDDMTAWDILAGNMARCLISSDLKRDSGFDGSSTGWTSWVEESSAFRLQKCIDKLLFCGNDQQPFEQSSTGTSSSLDDTIRWLKWMKASPAPIVVEISEDLRNAIDGIMTDRDYERVDQSPDEFLSRIACRIILLPSGGTLRTPLTAPPGAMVYGKLLYGGVTRYRILGNAKKINLPKRKVGERTEIAPPPGDNVIPTEAWLQYGGPERSYLALDIGPCAVLEITILPKGLRLPLFGEFKNETSMHTSTSSTQDMIATRVTSCDPRCLFYFPSDNVNATVPNNMKTTAMSQNALGYNYTLNDVETRFSTVLGGLKPEIQSIVRRVLDGRVHPESSTRSEEFRALLDLGLSPVRGVLLYGLPGCGKTAMAREISRLLTDRPPKIVSAPELLDRWVGGSERLVRELFADAEAELQICNGDMTKSGLHVVVIDEVDAVFRKRSSSSGSGEVARASAVNQILAKLDGVNALGNVLVIGTTNRRELLDEALLRPGRLEVQIEVPLPDREGRREILKIYFGPLRQRGRLSKPLCRAIDGDSASSSSSEDELSSSSWKRPFRRLPIVSWTTKTGKVRDLAADRCTGGFSGADLEGLVRCAGSIALSRARKDGSGVDGLVVTLEDTLQALEEVQR